MQFIPLQYQVLIHRNCLSIEAKDVSQKILHVDSLGHGLYAFVNGELAGVLLGIRCFLHNPSVINTLSLVIT